MSDGHEGKLKVSWSHLDSWFYTIRSEERLELKALWKKAGGMGGVWKVIKDWVKVRDVPVILIQNLLHSRVYVERRK